MKRNDEIAQLPRLLVVETAEDGGRGRLFIDNEHFN